MRTHRQLGHLDGNSSSQRSEIRSRRLHDHPRQPSRSTYLLLHGWREYLGRPVRALRVQPLAPVLAPLTGPFPMASHCPLDIVPPSSLASPTSPPHVNSMVSTPDTSFSSRAGCPRGRSKKTIRDAPPLPLLPSPQQSDCDSAHDLTDEPYQIIWDHFCGLPPSASSITFDLGGQATFEHLYERLDRRPGLLSYFEEQLWKEWDADTGVLLLRLVPMAEPMHEVLKMKLDRAIDAELDRIARDMPALQPLREKIIQASHSHVKKKTRRSRAPEFWKVPDGQTHFASQGYRYPPFLVEVAYSQDEKELLNTVKTYFTRRFPGKICTILSIKVQWAEEHRRKLPGHFHAASVSLWTSASAEDDDVLIRHVVDASFRDDKGRALPGAVAIPLASFLPLKERDSYDIPAHAELRLDFADLAGYVELGEARQRERDRTASRSPTPQQPEKRVRVLFADTAGAVVEEHTMPSKRRRTGSPPATARPRTRSQSEPTRLTSSPPSSSSIRNNTNRSTAGSKRTRNSQSPPSVSHCSKKHGSRKTK